MDTRISACWYLDDSRSLNTSLVSSARKLRGGGRAVQGSSAVQGGGAGRVEHGGAGAASSKGAHRRSWPCQQPHGPPARSPPVDEVVLLDEDLAQPRLAKRVVPAQGHGRRSMMRGARVRMHGCAGQTMSCMHVLQACLLACCERAPPAHLRLKRSKRWNRDLSACMSSVSTLRS